MSLYMLLDPAKWLADFMELTEMSLDYRLFLLVLALVGFGIAYVAERRLFPATAKYVGRLNRALRPSHPKTRKQYKEILEAMR